MSPFLEAFQHNANQVFDWAPGGGQGWVYAFGLVAVGCLALRREIRGITISGFLALLWLWMGVGFLRETPAWNNPKTWLGLLILLQGGLFFWFGAIRLRLPFEPRASVRPIAGTLLLVYALGIYPLYHVVLELPPSPLSLPFPGLVFTMGLMLFVLRPVPYQILLLPLLWAAAGGDRIFEELGWVDLINLAALAFALLLLVPTPEARRDGDENYRTETGYERVYRHRHRCDRLLWGLVLSTCLFTFLGTAGTSPAIFDRLAASSSVALAATTVFWLMSPAWFNIGFRYLAWWVVQGLRGLIAAGKWLIAGWERVLAVMAVVAFAGWFIGYHQKTDADDVYMFIGGLLVLVFLRAVYRARRCIVILPFVDSCGKVEEAERHGKALASRLRNELANIAELYRTIDEALPEQTGKIVASSVVVEDVVESVLDAIGPGSTAKLWNIEIPIGLVVRAVSRVVRGPRLTGSLQKDGKRYLLVADLSGGRWGPGSWKISSDDLSLGDERGALDKDPAQEETLIAQRLIEQLACRVIAKIGNVGSPRWEAIQHFTQGLRAYRGTQLAEKDTGPDLRRAEREFIQALREDSSFTQCHYDLGVVYQKLGEKDAAEASFRRCLAEDPARSEAYYSLANVYFENGDFRRASIYAGKALETQPGEARTWNLRGVAQDNAHRRKVAEEESGTSWLPLPEEVRIDLEIAVAVAWRDLFRAALKKPAAQPRKQTRLAGLCLANLAIIRLKDDEPDGREASRRLIGQALHLFPQEPWYHLILGENLVLQGNDEALERAQTELYRAFGDNLVPEDDADRWAYMLAAASRLSVGSGKKKGAKEITRREMKRAFRHFLDAAVPPEDLIMATGERARRRIGVGSYEDTLKICNRILVEVEDKVLGEGVSYVAALRNCLRFLRGLYVDPGGPVPGAPLGSPSSDEERQWWEAQLCIHRARTVMDRKPGQARADLTTAIDILERLDSQEGWPTRQVARQGLYALRAKAFLLEGKEPLDGNLLRKALADAQKSVAERPASAERRWILGDIYCVLRDFDQAYTEREMALKLGSSLEMLDGPEAICDLAQAYIKFAHVPDPGLQTERHRSALDFFVKLQDLIESKPLARDREVQELQLAVHACVHFWVGRFHEILNENSQAVYHLEIALAMGHASEEAARRLEKIYSESGFVVEAVRVRGGTESPQPGISPSRNVAA